jgi:hypothetical protein
MAHVNFELIKAQMTDALCERLQVVTQGAPKIRRWSGQISKMDVVERGESWDTIHRRDCDGLGGNRSRSVSPAECSGAKSALHEQTRLLGETHEYRPLRLSS